MSLKSVLFGNSIKKPTSQTSNGQSETESQVAEVNPYLLGEYGRREWNDRYQNLAKSIRNWQMVCAMLGSIAIILSVAVAVLAGKNKLQPYAVELNKGMPIAIQPMNPISSKDQLIIYYALTQFITDSRTRLNDTEALRSNLHKAYAFTTGKATDLLTDYYTKHDPFKEAGETTVKVKIINALPLGGHTWQVYWEETRSNASNGQLIGTTSWMANVSYIIGEAEPDKVNENPFGIYVPDFSWSQSSTPT